MIFQPKEWIFNYTLIGMMDLTQMGYSEIRKVTLNDLDQLKKIGRQTFYETFAESNSEANMKSYLEQEFSEEKLTAQLNNINAEFYFAIFEEKVVGYVKLNVGAAQTELQDNNALEIERIYVSKAFHGKGIGQVLYDKAIQRAEQQGMKYIWLGVWGENFRAINFYKKNGFVEFDKHIFRFGDEEQTDIMMKRQLNNG